MKKNYYKPVYKKKLRFRDNILEKKLPSSFKKKKWKFLLNFLKRKRTRIIDHHIFFRPKFGSFFQRNFKQILIIKQKISSYYGFLTLKTLKNIYKLVKTSFKSRLNKKSILPLASFFFRLLENRLDIVLYRSYFARSIREAKFFINSGQVYVNGTKALTNSMLLKTGDLITFKQTLYLKLIENLKYINVGYSVPNHLLINYYTFQIFLIFDTENIKLSDVYPFKINFKFLIKKLTF